MEFLNGIFCRGFWAKTRVFSDSRYCLVFYPHFSVLKMIFMNRPEFLKGFLKPEKSLVFFKSASSDGQWVKGSFFRADQLQLVICVVLHREEWDWIEWGDLRSGFSRRTRGWVHLQRRAKEFASGELNPSFPPCLMCVSLSHVSVSHNLMLWPVYKGEQSFLISNIHHIVIRGEWDGRNWGTLNQESGIQKGCCKWAKIQNWLPVSWKKHPGRRINKGGALH